MLVSVAEAVIFNAVAPQAQARTHAIGNGVNADFFSPDARLESPYAAGEQAVVFTGAMDYWPNIDAVSWFATDLLPRVRERFPGLRFWIVGRDPTPAVRALASDDVRVTGSVPDVRPYLAHADVVVVPLRIARGIQNKVLEAMAMARPVVVSEASASGLYADFGVDCELAHGADGQISSIVRLLQNETLRCSMGSAARRRVVTSHSWRAHLGILDGLFVSDELKSCPLAVGTRPDVPI